MLYTDIVATGFTLLVFTIHLSPTTVVSKKVSILETKFSPREIFVSPYEIFVSSYETENSQYLVINCLYLSFIFISQYEPKSYVACTTTCITTQSARCTAI